MQYEVIKPSDGDDNPIVIGEIEFVDGELRVDTDNQRLLEAVKEINAETPRGPADTDDLLGEIGQFDERYDHTEDTAIYRLGSLLSDTDLIVREK